MENKSINKITKNALKARIIVNILPLVYLLYVAYKISQMMANENVDINFAKGAFNINILYLTFVFQMITIILTTKKKTFNIVLSILILLVDIPFLYTIFAVFFPMIALCTLFFAVLYIILVLIDTASNFSD